MDIYLERMHPWAETSEFMNTASTLHWRLDAATFEPMGIEIKSKLGDFSGEYRKTRPLSALWLAPIQNLLGFGLYLFSFCKLMRGLKK